MFSHVTTGMLSRHVNNIVVIWWFYCIGTFSYHIAYYGKDDLSLPWNAAQGGGYYLKHFFLLFPLWIDNYDITQNHNDITSFKSRFYLTRVNAAKLWRQPVDMDVILNDNNQYFMIIKKGWRRWSKRTEWIDLAPPTLACSSCLWCLNRCALSKETANEQVQ